MIEPLRKVFDAVKSENEEMREEAILQLAMLLEKHSTLRNKSEFYDSILSSGLSNITLDEYERKELAHELYSLAMSDKITSSIIWALGKAGSDIALKPLLTLLCRRDPQLGEDSTWQALSAINKFWSVGEGHPSHQPTILLVKEYDLASMLQRLSHTGTARLKELAQRMLKKL